MQLRNQGLDVLTVVGGVRMHIGGRRHSPKTRSRTAVG